MTWSQRVSARTTKGAEITRVYIERHGLALDGQLYTKYALMRSHNRHSLAVNVINDPTPHLWETVTLLVETVSASRR